MESSWLAVQYIAFVYTLHTFFLYTEGSPVLHTRFGSLSAPVLPPTAAAFPFSPPHITSYPPPAQFYPLPPPHLRSPLSPHHSPYILPYSVLPHGHASPGGFLPIHTPFPPNYPSLHLMSNVRPMAVPYSGIAREFPGFSSTSSCENERQRLSFGDNTTASVDTPVNRPSPSQETRPKESSHFVSVIRPNLSHSLALDSRESERASADVNPVTREADEDEDVEVVIVRSPMETEGTLARSLQEQLQKGASDETQTSVPSNSHHLHSKNPNTGGNIPASGTDTNSSSPCQQKDIAFQFSVQQHVQRQCPKNLLTPPALKRAGVDCNEAAVVSKIIEHVRPHRELLGKAAVEHALRKCSPRETRTLPTSCTATKDSGRSNKLRKRGLERKEKLKRPLAHHITSVPLLGCS